MIKCKTLYSGIVSPCLYQNSECSKKPTLLENVAMFREAEKGLKEKSPKILEFHQTCCQHILKIMCGFYGFINIGGLDKLPLFISKSENLWCFKTAKTKSIDWIQSQQKDKDTSVILEKWMFVETARMCHSARGCHTKNYTVSFSKAASKEGEQK